MKCLSIVPIKTNRIETKNRKIITDIPAPDTIDTIKKCLQLLKINKYTLSIHGCKKDSGTTTYIENLLACLEGCVDKTQDVFYYELLSDIFVPNSTQIRNILHKKDKTSYDIKYLKCTMPNYVKTIIL